MTSTDGNAAAIIREAIASSERPESDRARDSDRQPAAIMEFFGVSTGMKVADLMTGSGYYAELLARVVGSEGRVYAHNTPFVLNRFAEKPLSERLARMSMPHVQRWDRELEDLGLPEGELDVVQMVMFYHDTYWQGVDRTAMNRGVYQALKPGGIYGIVDHHAAAGTGDEHVKSLHRVEAELVKKEIVAAGFEFVADSDALAHPDDDRTINVFDKSIRGKTDRFVLKFRKPQ